MLFLGTDHAGDLLPSRPLREKYSTPRRDVGPPGDDGSDSGGGQDPDSGGSGPSGLDFGGMTIL